MVQYFEPNQGGKGEEGKPSSPEPPRIFSQHFFAGETRNRRPNQNRKKRKMKTNKFLSMIMAGACLLSVCACAPQAEPTPEPEPEPEPGDIYEQYEEVPVEYEKQEAEAEDEALSLWFDHAFAKTPRGVTTSTGRDTYKIYMGKNEKEDCQFFLSSAEAKTFTVSVSDFTSENGGSIETSLFYQYYFSMPYNGEEQDVPDAIPPVTEKETFTLAANTSQGFVLQAETEETTPAGEYTAELEVFNAGGEQIKKATVFLKVWDFVLSDDSACRTAMWIEEARLAGVGDYKTYYDYLLENRVNAYDLPYALDDERVDEYLNDDRVNSFNILGFKFNLESGQTETTIKNRMRAAYNKLSANEEWFEKGYFYLVDEPASAERYKLEWIKMYGEWLEECYPGYRQMSPFYIDEWYDDAHTQDWIEFLRPYINIWVPKTYAYTTLREYGSLVDGRILYQEGQEGAIDAAFGSYPSRIENMVEEDGAEAWWYVTSQPSAPYITLNTTEPGVAYRILFWQQKMNGVTGFLYWSVNYWEGDGWNNREAEWTGGQMTYGNGQLLYPGGKVGQAGPVGSLRLEAVRDGIEDYQTFTMLEQIVGSEAVEEFINRTTTHVAVWNSENDHFAGERVILGNYLEALLSER